MSGKVEFLSQWPPDEPAEQPDHQTEKKVDDEAVNDQNDEDDDEVVEEDETMISVDALVASWWRKRLSEKRSPPLPPDRGSSSASSSSFRNPKTLLKAVKRLPEAQAFMRKQLERRQKRMRMGKSRAAAERHLVATLLSELGQYRMAAKENTALLKDLKIDQISCLKTVEYLEKLEKLTVFQKEVLWFSHKVDLQVASTTTTSTTTVFSTKDQAGCQLEVKRISAKDFAVKDFREKYCADRVPLIITDVNVTKANSAAPEEDNGGSSRRDLWTLDLLTRVAGHRKVTLKRGCPDSVEWAKLENSSEKTVAQFVQEIKDNTSSSVSKEYLFDWSLPLFCPELNDRFRIPDYVAHDYLKRTSEGALYRNSWPSLFVSGAGNGSQLHVDAFGSNFWMFLFSGRKKWTFYRAQDLNRLNPTYHGDSLDPVFPAVFPAPVSIAITAENVPSTGGEFSAATTLGNLPTTGGEFSAAITAENVPSTGGEIPARDEVPSYTVTLEAGEMLFVPHGSPHRVENLTDTIAVSGNFVDGSNVKEVTKHLRINALLDPRAGDLLKELAQLGLLEK